MSSGTWDARPHAVRDGAGNAGMWAAVPPSDAQWKRTIGMAGWGGGAAAAPAPAAARAAMGGALPHAPAQTVYTGLTLPRAPRHKQARPKQKGTEAGAEKHGLARAHAPGRHTHRKGPGAGATPADAGGPDVFVQISAVERAGIRDLNEGQKIAYEIVADRRTGKSSADNLKPV